MVVVETKSQIIEMDIHETNPNELRNLNHAIYGKWKENSSARFVLFSDDFSQQNSSTFNELYSRNERYIANDGFYTRGLHEIEAFALPVHHWI